MEKRKIIKWTELKNCKTEKEKAGWIKNFCDKYGIVSPTQLAKEYKGAFVYYSQLSNINKNIVFPNRRKYNDWAELRNLKTEKERVIWIKNFCDKHGITLPGQLDEEFNQIYKYYSNFSEENKEKIFPNKRKNWAELKNLKTEKERARWVKDFCDEHGITLPGQLYKEFRQVFRYYSNFSEENKEKIFPNKRKNWAELRNLKTEKEKVIWIKKFCDEYEITSSGQLNEEFRQVFSYYSNFSKENKEKIFSPIKSRGEEILGKLLVKFGYIFTTQKDFQDLKSNKGHPLYYDVFIPSKNCLVEYHGGQHFSPENGYYSEEGIERDRIKYQYAIDHKINICYITECKIEYEEYGYFTSVFTSWNEAMEYINSLPDVIVDAEDTAQN